MNLKLEDVAAQRSFVFLWCGSCEGLDIGREVSRTSSVSVARRSDIAYWELLQYMCMNRHLLYLLDVFGGSRTRYFVTTLYSVDVCGVHKVVQHNIHVLLSITI